MCVACGAQGQPCCTGNVCTGNNTICDNFTCVRCGRRNDLCCAGDTCQDPEDDVCVNGGCYECGGDSEPCCAGGECDHNGLVCTSSTAACEPP
jgi:hypothetical protein